MYKLHEVAGSPDTGHGMSGHGGIKSITAKPHQIADDTGKTAIFIGRVEFNDGSFYEDYGEASVKNIKMGTLHTFLNHMASRRATNRAIRLAVGFGLTSADELSEVEPAGETIQERLLTEKEFQVIADVIAEIEGCFTEEELSQIKIPDGLNEFQIAAVNKVISNVKKVIVKQ